MIEFFVSVLAGLSAVMAFGFIKWVYALVRAQKTRPVTMKKPKRV